MSEQWFERDPLWFKRAVFYEIHIRGFFDGNDDGSGDFRGLIEKLDFLQWIGVDCIWLLPMYVSPLKDGGYDIADFFAIHPDYGTVDDFRDFVEQAHQRGIRVIADLVMNHTSADHPWFQESRSDPDGPKGDWYMWSDTDDRWPEARIIFIDSEPSNWTFDPVRGQYYWHRFFHHQPDLNFESPAVRRDMLEIMEFWLDRGLDGFRCDAVPYLFEREGTNCENLPETHDFLREVRRHIDARYDARVLLAEANQWPSDVRPYFGDGDEFHMAFHFPLMPRLFLAVRRSDRRPITDIFVHTPEIPPTCQWCLFLRNHDELDLGRLTEEQRQQVFQCFGPEKDMQLYERGIRRRLAPMLNGDRRIIELAYSLIFTLPGTPVLRYGDEIGMGDDLGLPERNCARTPMQWSTEPHGGFTTADKPVMPVISDGPFGYQHVNAAEQRRDPKSLLNWTERIVRMRKEVPEVGWGEFEILSVRDAAVLAIRYDWRDNSVLFLHNLSDTPREVAFSVGLRGSDGRLLVNLLSENHSQASRDGKHRMLLEAYGYRWYRVGGLDYLLKRSEIETPPRG